MAPRVFIPQQPSRYNRTIGDWIPTVNIDPAKKFGDPIIMLPPGVGRVNTAPLISAMRNQMADFTCEDWIVALGDPSLIAAAACIAQRHTGGLLRILKWDRVVGDYVPVEMQL